MLSKLVWESDAQVRVSEFSVGLQAPGFKRKVPQSVVSGVKNCVQEYVKDNPAFLGVVADLEQTAVVLHHVGACTPPYVADLVGKSVVAFLSGKLSVKVPDRVGLRLWAVQSGLKLS